MIEEDDQGESLMHALTILSQTYMPSEIHASSIREFKIIQFGSQTNLVWGRLSSRYQQATFLPEDSREVLF